MFVFPGKFLPVLRRKRFRKPVLYPLSYGRFGAVFSGVLCDFGLVTDLGEYASEYAFWPCSLFTVHPNSEQVNR